MKNVYSDLLIANPGTRWHDGVLTLEVRLPWYRGLPLSVVRVAQLIVDGQPVSLEAATLQVNDRTYTLAELADATTASWFVLDSAFLQVPLPAAAAPQQADLLLNLHPPYIPMLTWSTRGTAALAAA